MNAHPSWWSALVKRWNRLVKLSPYEDSQLTEEEQIELRFYREMCEDCQTFIMGTAFRKYREERN